MALTFEIRDGLMEIKFHGDVLADDFLRLVDLMQAAESRLEVSPDRILDFSESSFMHLATFELINFATRRNYALLKNEVKAAIIAPKPEQYGHARLVQTYNQNPKIKVRVFNDAASAYEWLGRAAKAGG